MTSKPLQDQLSLPSASLRPEVARIIAEIFIECGDWEQTRERVLSENSLQARSSSSNNRMEMEFRKRLQTLTAKQLDVLATAPSESSAAMTWLAVCKSSQFVFDFAADILRGKIENMDPVLRRSDYESFVEAQALIHAKVASLTPSTRVKLRGVVLKMLRETGILGKGRDDVPIHRPLIPADVQDAIIADDPKWLAVFLVPDDEIIALRS